MNEKKTKESKPLEIAAEELKKRLSETISEALSSGIPALAIEPLLIQFSSEIQTIKQAQYQTALKYYEENAKTGQ